MKSKKVGGILFLVTMLLGVVVQAASAQQSQPPYRIYLPLVSRQSLKPVPLIAPADGAFHFTARRGDTAATWQELFIGYDYNNDLSVDAAFHRLPQISAQHPTITATVPLSAGQRLEIRLYADTFGSVITPHPIWYRWDSRHTREGAPAPLVIVGDSPWEAYWECDNDYDYQDLCLEIIFEEQP